VHCNKLAIKNLYCLIISILLLPQSKRFYYTTLWYEVHVRCTYYVDIVDKTREQLLLLCRGSRRFSVTKSPPENYRRRLWGGGATGVRASSMFGCRDCARKIIISEIRIAPHFTAGLWNRLNGQKSLLPHCESFSGQLLTIIIAITVIIIIIIVVIKFFFVLRFPATVTRVNTKHSSGTGEDYFHDLCTSFFNDSRGWYKKFNLNYLHTSSSLLAEPTS